MSASLLVDVCFVVFASTALGFIIVYYLGLIIELVIWDSSDWLRRMLLLAISPSLTKCKGSSGFEVGRGQVDTGGLGILRLLTWGLLVLWSILPSDAI